MTSHLLESYGTEEEVKEFYETLPDKAEFDDSSTLLFNILDRHPDGEFKNIFKGTLSTFNKLKHNVYDYELSRSLRFYIHRKYKFNIGEVEANATVARMLLTSKQRRQLLPKESLEMLYRQQGMLLEEETLENAIDSSLNPPVEIFGNFDSDMTASLMVQSDHINKELLGFLEGFGFEINQAENILIDMASKDINLDLLDIEQVAEVLSETLSLMLMRSPMFNTRDFRNNIRFKNIVNEIKEQEEFKDTKYEVLNVLAARQMIQEVLSGKFEDAILKEYGMKRDVVSYMKKVIKQWKQIFQGVDTKLLYPIIDEIVDNTFMGTDFVSKTNWVDRKQVNFQEAFDENDLAKDIMNKIGRDDKILLTGSIVLSLEGTVFRPEGDLVHDLDFISNYKTKGASEDLLKRYYPGRVYLAYSFSS